MESIIHKRVAYLTSGKFGTLLINPLNLLIEDLLVITQKSFPETSAKSESRRLKIKCLEIETEKGLEKILSKRLPDALIVSDFGMILSKKILEHTKPVINIHPSLLPRYRGASPYVSAILNGDKKTGISILEMVHEIDAGPIYAKESLVIAEDETSVSIREKLGNLASSMLKKHLSAILSGRIKPKPQKGRISFTKRFTREDGKIDWNDSAKQIEQKVRAFIEWPGTYINVIANSKTIKLKILEAEEVKENKICDECNGDFLNISTKKGILSLKKVQPEGKSQMEIADFLRGYKNIKILN